MILVPFFEIPYGDRLAKNVKSLYFQVHGQVREGNKIEILQWRSQITSVANTAHMSRNWLDWLAGYLPRPSFITKVSKNYTPLFKKHEREEGGE